MCEKPSWPHTGWLLQDVPINTGKKLQLMDLWYTQEFLVSAKKLAKNDIIQAAL